MSEDNMVSYKISRGNLFKKRLYEVCVHNVIQYLTEYKPSVNTIPTKAK